MKETIKFVLVGFLGVFVGWAIVAALTVDETIPSLRAYLKALFLTNDGTPSGATTIVVDWQDGSITMQGDLNIQPGAIKDSTIVSADIANGTIRAEDIWAGQVVNTNLAANSVTSDKIVDGTITAADLWAGSVGNSELQDNSVTSAKIRDGEVTSADIRDWTITAADLGANIDVSSSTDGKNVRVDYATTAWYAASAWSATTVTSTVDKAKQVVSPNGTAVGIWIDSPYLRTPYWIGFWRSNRGAHLNEDWALYRYWGQVFLTVDDYFVVRDTDGSYITRSSRGYYDGLRIYYSSNRSWNIRWTYTDVRTYAGAIVDFYGNYIDEWAWRLSASTTAYRLGVARIGEYMAKYNCVKVQWLDSARYTVDRAGNFTNPDWYYWRFKFRCYY